MVKHFRRALTSTVIALGPENRAVLWMLSRKCRQFGTSLKHCGEHLALTKGDREMRLAPQHYVYALDMSERFDIYFAPLVPATINGKLVLDYSRPGVLQTYASSGLQFEMASFPEEDDAIEDYFRMYRPEAGDVVFDIGAHCGVSSYHFANLVGPTGHVFAFEPDPVNYELLLRNIERHQLTNVTPLQIAIAGNCGEAAFHSEGTIGSGLARHSSRTSVGKLTMVKTATLEAAFDQWGPPQFCKIDIEGAEMEVVGAAREFLRKTRCQFALDTNHLVDGTFTDKRIEALYGECGYVTASSTEGMRTTWAWPE